MTNWLSTGAEFDGVFANNDEMAIGAIQAMKARRHLDMASVIVTRRRRDAGRAGVAMQAGDLDVTVFQNAAGRGRARWTRRCAGAGRSVDQKVYIPFELVTPANIDQFLSKN
jgi:inositol transport system substrate-binding protein